MAIEIAERKSLQLVVGAHTEIICNPLSHALGVVVRDVGRERAHQCDGHNHDRRRRRDLHFAAAGQYWFQDVVQPRRESVAADNVIQNDLEGSGRGQAHRRLHQHGQQDEEKVGPVRTNHGSEQRDQLDDSRVRRFRSAISTTAHCSAVVTPSQLQPGRGRALPPQISPIEISRDYQSCNL